MVPVKKHIGNFTFFFYSSAFDAEGLMRALARARTVEGRGRGGIKIVEVEGLGLVSRQYMHGGLFRALTRDLFLGHGRATGEAGIMVYLRENGFPAVKPFCVIVERLFLFNRLHLVTHLQEEALELFDHLIASTRKERLRCVHRLAGFFFLMKQAAVYHPDFHLRNVLVTRGGGFTFLDFDRARKRQVSDRDMKSMFRRMERFADKMSRQGRFEVSDKEKALFLRSYARLSGKDFSGEMKSAAFRASFLNRLGWFVESILYRRKT